MGVESSLRWSGALHTRKPGTGLRWSDDGYRAMGVQGSTWQDELGSFRIPLHAGEIWWHKLERVASRSEWKRGP
ncbi:hypothetical protein CS8_003820 [Cupriavidus sp. 8B]